LLDSTIESKYGVIGSSFLSYRYAPFLFSNKVSFNTFWVTILNWFINGILNSLPALLVRLWLDLIQIHTSSGRRTASGDVSKEEKEELATLTNLMLPTQAKS